MTSGSRLPSCKERETNKRRERRRRAIAAKIYAGLRMYGNYKLPKHCDNNEVLKALCREAGWSVEEDGTIYREGCKPVEHMDVVGGSASPSPCSSYQPSPCASYNPSPISSSIPSPKSSSHIAIASNANKGTDANSLIPWLKNLSSSASSSAASSKLPNYHHPYLHGGSISAPVTPPLSSPTARSPRIKTDWDNPTAQSSWSANHHTFLPSSTPPSPCRPAIPGSGWLAGIRIPTGSPSSPTFSLVSSNPFGPYIDASAGGDSSRMWTPGQSGTCSPVMPGGRSSRMWTPGQSGTCSPAMPGGPDRMDVHMSDGVSDEFAFGSSSNDNHQMMTGLVKAWEGERIHEECGSEELELTLGSSRTRSDA